MAQIPEPEKVKIMQAESSMKIEEKRKLQAQEGKEFVVNEDGHGPGVIPEETWQEMKK